MEQTNKTILFEEINPNVSSLFTLIDDTVQDSISDDVLRKIYQSLEVRSFQECVDKMSPTVYMGLNIKRNQVSCSKEESDIAKAAEISDFEVISFPIQFEQSFLNYYIGIVSNKENRNRDTYDFERKLFGFQDMNYLYRNLMEIVSLYNRKCFGKAMKKLDEVLSMTSNGMERLYLYQFVLQKRLEAYCNGHQGSQILISDSEENQVRISAVAEQYMMRTALIRKEKTKEYEEWLEQIPQTHHKCAYMKETLMLFTEDCDLETLVCTYEEVSAFYLECVETFWSVAKPLYETMLGVFVFFEQYKDTEGMMHPTLVLANISVKDLVDQKSKKKLQSFLNTTNNKVYSEDIIWYAILPRLEYYSENIAGVRQRFQGTEKEVIHEVNELVFVSALYEILAEYRIQVFTSVTNCIHSSFEWVWKNGLDEWIDYHCKLATPQNADYVIPCFPNFALSTEKHIELCTELECKEIAYLFHPANVKHIWLEKPSIEASYVAAGIFAAIQCPQYLGKVCKKKINTEIPGVAFRIMEDEHNYQIPSILQSGMLSFPDEYMQQAERRCYGVFFSPYGRKIIISGEKALSGIYGAKDHLSMVQTLTYIERKIRYETQDFKAMLIEKFFQRRPGSLIGIWEKNRDMHNSILKTGESLEYRIDETNRECVFMISFKDMKTNRKVRLNG